MSVSKILNQHRTHFVLNARNMKTVQDRNINFEHTQTSLSRGFSDSESFVPLQRVVIARVQNPRGT